MTPENLDWVNLTNHAMERMEELYIGRSWLIGRIKAGHGFFFKDSKKGQWRYDFYCPDKDISAVVEVEYDTSWNSKTANVLTVFEMPEEKHINRYYKSDRFEKVETAATATS